MQTDYLVIGSGIAGALLSYELIQNGASVVVADHNDAFSKASRVAGAVINPLNISKWNFVKDHERYIRESLLTYAAIEKFLNIHILHRHSIFAFHGGETSKALFEQSKKAIDDQLQQISGEEEKKLQGWFDYKYGVEKISPVWRIDAALLLSRWRRYLSDHAMLTEDRFEYPEAVVEAAGVRWKDIIAKKIIFCEGADAIHNPFFSKIPFTRNRGEALLVDIPTLDALYIYHQQLRLVPAHEGLFWCGSNYKWDYNDLLPDQLWRQYATAVLNKWLRVPYTVIDHIVAERPTTAGQAPVVMLHPEMPSMAMLNGLGTRGFSMGPSLAKQMAKMLLKA